MIGTENAETCHFFSLVLLGSTSFSLRHCRAFLIDALAQFLVAALTKLDQID